MTDALPDLDEYRERASTWLAEHLELRDPSARPRVHGRDHKTREMFEPERALQRQLFGAGYAGITWPREYGGQGLPAPYEAAFINAARRYRTPEFGAAAGTTFNVCGRTMLAHASPEFLARHVPRMLAGDELWVQFFSEPGAGLDLAGVTTRADRDGDHWILNGAKVWTSAGHYADFGMCLARTDWDVPKHRGLTWFAIDVTAPGVTVSPIRELNGAAEFSQEQFDDVVLTDADVIGDVNDGWTVAQTMLVFERGGGIANAPALAVPPKRRFAPDLVGLAERGGRVDDAHVRQLIAREHIDEFAVGELRKRMGERMRAEGAATAGLASYAKLAGGVGRARRVVTAMEIGRARTHTWAPGDDDGETAALAFLNGRLGCIAGGTNEIQRNGIGERVLGLPREPSFDTTRPFRDVVHEAANWEGIRMTANELPSYDQLPVVDGAPARSSWGVWGDRDVFGALNLQTPERARRAAASIRTGRWFSLDLDLGLPDPPLFGRPPFRHEVTGPIGGGHDDLLHDWNTQSSSQWDGFRHFAYPKHGHYGGVPDEEHGMHHWAGRGLAGRCVLLDLDRWRTAAERPLRQGTADPIGVTDLAACIADQGTAIEVGDTLLLRTGWLTWYRSLSQSERVTYASEPPLSPGPAGDDLPAFLWNLHVSAVAADNPGVEMFPPMPGHGFLHPHALPLLGIPLGELWDLDALAQDCADAGTYDAFLTSAPIHVRGGVGSPPNAIAVR